LAPFAGNENSELGKRVVKKEKKLYSIRELGRTV